MIVGCLFVGLGYDDLFRVFIILGILYPFEFLKVAFDFSEVPLGLEILGHHIVAFEFRLHFQLLVIFLHLLNCKNLGFLLFFQNLFLRIDKIIIFADIFAQIRGVPRNSVHNLLVVVDNFHIQVEQFLLFVVL